MDKLSEHAIRMLEIEGKGKNDGYIETRNMGEIARAVYDVILQVQMLKIADRKTEPQTGETQDGFYDEYYRDHEEFYEPQTDCAWGRGSDEPRTVPLYPMKKGEE